MDKRGLVSVKFLLVMACILVAFFTFYQHLNQRQVINDLVRGQELIVANNLARYDSYLYKHYGLLASQSLDKEGTYKSPVTQDWLMDSLEGGDSLQDIEALRQQIISQMTLKLPSTYGQVMQNKLDLVGDANKTKLTMDLQSQVYDYMTAFDGLIQVRQSQTLRVNAYDPLEAMKRLEEVLIQWPAWQETYKTLMSQRDQRLEEKNRSLASYQAYEKQVTSQGGPDQEEELILDRLFRAYEAANRAYLETERLVLSQEDLGQVMVDQVMDQKKRLVKLLEDHRLLEDNLVLVLEDRQTIMDDIEVSLQKLIENDGLQVVLEALYLDMSKLKHSLDQPWYQEDLIQQTLVYVRDNITCLKTILVDLKDEPTVSLEAGTWMGLNLDLLLDLHLPLMANPQAKSKPLDPKAQATYDQALKDKDRVYSYEGKGQVIHQDQISTSSGSPNFWSLDRVGDLVKTGLDNVKINEYIMGTFKSFVQGSDSDIDLFTKYQRTSYLNRGEVEYVLYGLRTEAANINKTMVHIYTIRLAMNTLHIYMDPQKMAASEAVGLGLAGWTGFLAPVVTQVVRLAWSTGESFIDMNKLRKGEGVPFYKISPSQWQLDLGLVCDPVDEPSDVFDLSYHDYLRLFLLTLDDNLKLERIQDLLTLNLLAESRPHDLSFYYTSYSHKAVIPLFGGEYESIYQAGY